MSDTADVIDATAGGGRAATAADPQVYPSRPARGVSRSSVRCPFPGATAADGCVLIYGGVAADPERTRVLVDGRVVATASVVREATAELPTDAAGGIHTIRCETLDRSTGTTVVGSADLWEYVRPGSAVASYTVPYSVPRHTGLLPHPAADGTGVRATYHATKSRPILSMYQFDGATLATETGVSFGAGGLGLNTVTQGWLAAADLYGGGYTLAGYVAAWEGYFDALAALVPSGWMWLAASDDLVGDGGRTLTQIDFYVNRTGVADWGPDYLAHALTRLKATGKVPVVLVGDEFGDTSRYPNVPKTGSAGLAAIAAAVRAGDLPQGWQLALKATTSDPQGWADTYSNDPDYADGAIVASGNVVDRLYDGLLNAPGVYDCRLATRFALHTTAADRFRMSQLNVTASFYHAAPGYSGSYRPGVDRLTQGPWPPAGILCQYGTAIVNGACGGRLYEYDHGIGRVNRARAYQANDPLPDRSYGLSPTDTPTSWAVVSAANSWWATHFERLCQAPATLPAFGSDWEVGAWDGGSGKRLVLACNATDCRRAIPLVPTGTWTGGGTLSVSGTTVTTTGTTPTAGQTVQPGGWCWWLG